MIVNCAGRSRMLRLGKAIIALTALPFTGEIVQRSLEQNWTPMNIRSTSDFCPLRV